MGSDKALLELGGRSLLEHALSMVRQVCPEVAIVGDPAKFGVYGSVIQDAYSGCGPLAGIHAALQHTSAELNLVLAVDMPLVSPELLRLLVAAAEVSDALVTVPRTGRGFQPLCAVYRPAFAALADKALREGKYKIDALFSEVGTRMIEEGDLAGAGFTERSFFNVNTPDDLRFVRAESIKP